MVEALLFVCFVCFLQVVSFFYRLLVLLFVFYRLLVGRARRIAQEYRITYNECIPVSQLVQKVATVMQEYTQQG